MANPQVQPSGGFAVAFQDPSTAEEMWPVLSVQLTRSNAVIYIPATSFDILDEDGRAYLLEQYL